ncbi:MAG: ester cyclase [Anaerolineae bacterium]
MSLEQNKALVRRSVEASNARDPDAYDEFYPEDYVMHLPGGQELGRAEWKQMGDTFLAAFPDQHVTLDDMIAEGDKVAVRGTNRCTHQGELMGIPPTGKQVTYTWMSINRIAGGKIVETWAEHDLMGLMQQLGALPTPGEGEG